MVTFINPIDDFHHQRGNNQIVDLSREIIYILSKQNQNEEIIILNISSSYGVRLRK